ncbi:MAG: UbiA family prenyltransferase [Saprospiraceae bacterium]
MKEYLINLWHQYINLHLHLSLCLILFVLFQYKSVGGMTSTPFLFLLYVATLLVYNLHDINIKDFRNVPKIKKSIVFLCGSIIICLFPFLSRNVLLSLIPAAIVATFYILPLMKGSQKLRDLPWIKIFALSGVLSYCSVIIPLIDVGVDKWVIFLIFLSRMVFFLALGLVFDIRDIDADRAQPLKSFPVYLGLYRSKWLIFLLLCISTGLDFYMVNHFIIELSIFISLFLTNVVFLFFLRFNISQKNANKFSFLADGLLSLPFSFYLILA